MAYVLHLLILRYTAPADRISPLVPGHVEYLDRLHSEGTFLLSGQTVPDSIGGVILAVGSRIDVERIAGSDPFVTAGVAEYEILTVEPARVHEDLHTLLNQDADEEADWERAALTRLRTGDLTVQREGRPLSAGRS